VPVPQPPPAPRVRVPLPGPNAQKVVERDTRALFTTTKTAPVVVARAWGCTLEDVDGNLLLDFTSGVGVTNVGHAHPGVVKAVQDQAARFLHFAGTDYYYEILASYAERLTSVVPGPGAKKVFFTNSGTESVEAALKIARYATERPQFLAFFGAFHGRTLGSLSLSSSKIVHRQRFFPTTPGTHHAPYANPYRNLWGIDGYAQPDELVDRVLDFVEGTILSQTLPPDDLAAIVVEPVQGEGGYIVPPPTFLPRLRKLAKEKGALLVCDEVQTGFGRTGKLFAVEHTGTTPDAIALAKGIASGIPMGAVVARADLDFPVSGAHSNTFGGNPVACAAATATLDALLGEGMVRNAEKEGRHLRERLLELQAKHRSIGDVRGLGLMLATDFVKDPRTKEPDAATRDRVVQAAFQRGLVLLPAGKSAIRYIPPLCITAEEVDAGADVLVAALKDAGAA